MPVELKSLKKDIDTFLREEKIIFISAIGDEKPKARNVTKYGISINGKEQYAFDKKHLFDYIVKNYKEREIDGRPQFDIELAWNTGAGVKQ